MAARRRKKSYKRRSLKELISVRSSHYLKSLAQKLNPNSKVKIQIQDELAARDINQGGPEKDWGHG